MSQGEQYLKLLMRYHIDFNSINSYHWQDTELSSQRLVKQINRISVLLWSFKKYTVFILYFLTDLISTNIDYIGIISSSVDSNKNIC